jgi:hypothetical protein
MMKNRILAFRELPFNRAMLPQALIKESYCKSMMQVVSFPIVREGINHEDVGGSLGRVYFGESYIPYYHYTKCLYVSPANNYGNIHGIIWDDHFCTKETAYAELTQLLLAFNRHRTNNTLYPEDVFERLP